MQVNLKDFACGSIFIALGVLFSVMASMTLNIGTITRMGPGYFPIVVAALVIIIGAIIAVRAFFIEPDHEFTLAWRSLVLISLAPVVFALTIRRFGMIPAVILIVLIALFASQRANLRMAALLSLSITAICVLVFHFGLDLPIPLFQWS